MSQTFTDQEYQNANIILKRGPCFGTCPVYTLSVAGSGWVVYHGEDFVDIKGNHEIYISPTRAKELILTFVIQEFFSYARDYDEYDNWTDLSCTYLTLSIGGISKTASRYAHPPSYPKRLHFLETEVERVTNAVQWVGQQHLIKNDTAGAPFGSEPST